MFGLKKRVEAIENRQKQIYFASTLKEFEENKFKDNGEGDYLYVFKHHGFVDIGQWHANYDKFTTSREVITINDININWLIKELSKAKKKKKEKK